MYYSKIKLFAENKKIAIKDLAQKANLTEAGLHQMIRKESIKVDVLERISVILDIPIQLFFEETISQTVLNEPLGKYSDKSCSACKEKERLITQLQDQLKDKERLIQVLENKADKKQAC